MLDALFTVIVALPAPIDFTVTLFPLKLTVATFVFEEDTLNVPVFPLTVNEVLLGYVIVPL